MLRNRRRQSDNAQKDEDRQWVPEDAPEDAESDDYDEAVAKKRKLYRRLPTPGIIGSLRLISSVIRLLWMPAAVSCFFCKDFTVHSSTKPELLSGEKGS